MSRKKNYFNYLIEINIIYIVLLVLLLILSNNMCSYAYWYEEPEIYETKNINDMWWLSRKQKEAVRQKQAIELNKKIEENKNKEFKNKNIKWIYSDIDIKSFPIDKWEVIDDDNDGIGYNYYFDKDGYLLIDTITPDYKIVDSKGREIDNNLNPVKYYTSRIVDETKLAEEETIHIMTREASQVIISNGVKLKNNIKLYDSSIDKTVNNYIEKSDRYLINVKATINNGVRWQNCSSLKGNSGYVIFNNPNNNFNKITGKIAVQLSPYEDDNTYTLKIYDQDEYDKYEEAHYFYDIYEIYETEIYDKTNVFDFSFTFDRSINRLRFEIETKDDYNSRTCYIKDLKYGFSKASFAEELRRKKDDAEEIEELKRLGIYLDDYSILEVFDEEGDIIEEDEEEHENENNDDRIGGISYDFEDYNDETKAYEDVVRDRNTGPAFDERLKNIKEIGPAFINIE